MLGLSGCAPTKIAIPDDYPQLKASADERDTLIYVKENANLGNYNKFYVAPIVIESDGVGSSNSITKEEAIEIAHYAENRLQLSLGEKLTLAPRPAPGVLSIHFRIIALTPTSKAQIVMMVPPFALVNLLSSKGLFLGSITLAGEVFEGMALEPSVAFVGTRSRPGADATVAFSRLAVAEKIIDQAAVRLAVDLEKARSRRQ
ncbi:hypothetical protein BLL42_28355 (plasmid) [Pseudomonas frederiksbergensis]|uniref:DUF3313 domain-containing protein n=2 Tax=Pseudomonas frederiksbergensis TaxID=104087 RepID=A0A1J0EUN2_9PSED|nr:hypothetical protein BLL42_28355 [Pseudomonas frederiksbergensis]